MTGCLCVILEPFVVKFTSQAGVWGLTMVHSCLPSTKQWTKMILSCSRAMILSLQTENSRLHIVKPFAQNVTSAWTNGYWRMKDGVYVRPWIGWVEVLYGWGCPYFVYLQDHTSCFAETRCMHVWAIRPRGSTPHDHGHSCRMGCLSILRNKSITETSGVWLEITQQDWYRFNVCVCTIRHLYTLLFFNCLDFPEPDKTVAFCHLLSVSLTLHTDTLVPEDSPCRHTHLPLWVDSAGVSRGWLIWPTGAFSTSPSVHSLSSHSTGHSNLFWCS